MDIVEIEKIVYNGYGFARKNDKIFFVDYVLPKEVVGVKTKKLKKNFVFASPIKIIKKAQARIQPLCKYFTICGGCDFQHIKYSNQLKTKKEVLVETLQRIGDVYFDFPLITIPSTVPFRYRTSANIKIENGKAGFYKKESREIVDIDKCPLFHPLLHEVYIKTVASNKKRKGSIKISIQKGTKKYQKVKNCFFKVSKQSFFQINAFQIDNLVNIVLENSIESEKFADLYSGVGLFSVFLCKKGKKGFSVESSTSSHKDAIFNRSLNNIKKNTLKLFNLKAEKSLNIIKKFKPDLLISDPPRNGIGINLSKKILEFDFIEKIIYISCNPATLARDLKVFKEKYKIKKIYFIDMFPQTFHIETVAVLEK
jgi:23S rRNA (uracil1939-C5)-methyltransferase